jgi:hypothetical protein
LNIRLRAYCLDLLLNLFYLSLLLGHGGSNTLSSTECGNYNF